MPKPLHFWYEFASPYACLSAFRIDEVAKAKGVEVIWHPFLLGAVFKALGTTPVPMASSPQKLNYMWMDAARQAKGYGFKFQRPSQFPRNGLTAARVALLGMEQGWGQSFSRKVYEANFVKDQDIGNFAVLANILKAMDLDPKRTLEAATREENKLALRAETQKAVDLGVFGVPTFFVAGEQFWGDDRLEQALQAAS